MRLSLNKGFSRSFDPAQEYCAHFHFSHLDEHDECHNHEHDDHRHPADDMPRKVQSLHFPEIANLVPGTESLSSPFRQKTDKDRRDEKRKI